MALLGSRYYLCFIAVVDECAVIDMKVKEIDATANMAWSPASASPIMLAAGTAAQQVDPSFPIMSLILV